MDPNSISMRSFWGISQEQNREGFAQSGQYHTNVQFGLYCWTLTVVSEPWFRGGGCVARGSVDCACKLSNASVWARSRPVMTWRPVTYVDVWSCLVVLVWGEDYGGKQYLTLQNKLELQACKWATPTPLVLGRWGVSQEQNREDFAQIEQYHILGSLGMHRSVSFETL